MKLNIGCGTDYREGFVNIDGSDALDRVDRIIDVSAQRIVDFFEASSVQHILANDIIEHHFHWETVDLMAQFFTLLAPGGTVEIRVPDVQHIIGSWRIPLERKIVLLYGGQDIPQGRDSEMDESRKHFPQYFCHKYGWTMASMKAELEGIGYRNVRTERARTNVVTHAEK